MVKKTGQIEIGTSVVIWRIFKVKKFAKKTCQIATKTSRTNWLPLWVDEFFSIKKFAEKICQIEAGTSRTKVLPKWFDEFFT